MVDIHVYQGKDGYRSYITQGRKTVVIDGYFDHEHHSLKADTPSGPYMYGT